MFPPINYAEPSWMDFSVCACVGNAANIIFIMWNSISGFDAWYYFLFNVYYGVAVTVRSHQKKISDNFLRGGGDVFEG